MVTICTASGRYMYRQFNNQQFYVLPHTAVFMCFVWISEQTAIISLYNINWLVCVTETECIYCVVRTGYLNTSGVTWLGRLGADILSLGPRRLFRTTPCEIYSAQSGNGTSSVLTAPCFPISATQPMLHAIFICKLLAADRQSAEAEEFSNTAIFFP